MSQGRLTHTALMHVHSTVLDEIDLSNLLQKFISKTAERKATVRSVCSFNRIV